MDSIHLDGYYPCVGQCSVYTQEDGSQECGESPQLTRSGVRERP